MSYEIDTKTPHPGHGYRGEYLDLLDRLKPGQSVKTKDKSTIKRIASGLRKALKARGDDGRYRVSIRTNMPDGYHRAFLLARPVKMADLPSRKIRNLKG